jgi:crossover junction endodeoxyribonuclease RuvC
MRILGIDPGIAITGWGIGDFDSKGTPTAIDYGAIFTQKGLTVGDRLLEIYTDLNSILNEFKPDYCGLETLLFYNNAKTAIVVGEARGVVLLTLQQHSIPVHEFTPLQVKSSISGYGKATKAQVQENVKMICSLDDIPKPDDVADALAISIACFDRLRMDELN